jgi:hypothetical protein
MDHLPLSPFVPCHFFIELSGVLIHVGLRNEKNKKSLFGGKNDVSHLCPHLAS